MSYNSPVAFSEDIYWAIDGTIHFLCLLNLSNTLSESRSFKIHKNLPFHVFLRYELKLENSISHCFVKPKTILALLRDSRHKFLTCRNQFRYSVCENFDHLTEV